MSTNDITGDRLHSRANSKAFDENFDKIFGKKRVCGDCDGLGYLVAKDARGVALNTYTCSQCNGLGKA